MIMKQLKCSSLKFNLIKMIVVVVGVVVVVVVLVVSMMMIINMKMMLQKGLKQICSCEENLWSVNDNDNLTKQFYKKLDKAEPHSMTHQVISSNVLSNVYSKKDFITS